MASSDLKSFCNACSRRSKSSAATLFCTDCDESFCKECTEVHCSLKAFDSHHVVNIAIVEENAFKVDRFCTEHQEKVIEFYCSDHDSICCRSCISGSHRTCENVLPMEDAAKNVKSSTMYEDTSKDLSHLCKTFESILEEKVQSVERINRNKVTAKEDLHNFITEVQAKIKELETKVLADIDSVHTTLISKSSQEKQFINEHEIKLKDILKEFEFVTKHGSESHIFLMLNVTKVKINEKEKELQEILSSQKFSEFRYKKSDLLSQIKSLGTVTVEDVPSSIEYKPLKVNQAQNNRVQKRLIRFEMEKTIALKHDGWVTRICSTGSGQLILCHWTSKSLLIYNYTGVFLEEINLSSNPWAAVYKDKANLVWVTLPYSNSVMTLNMNIKKPEQTFTCPGTCFGISLIKEGLVVGGKGEIYIMRESDGAILKTLKVGSHVLFTVKTTINNEIFCCETEHDNIYCVKLDGTILFTKHIQELPKPIDMIDDWVGNFYVISWITNNLIRLSSQGEFEEVMLTEMNGLSTPYAIAFNNDKSKIIICNYQKESLLLFRCIYQ